MFKTIPKSCSVVILALVLTSVLVACSPSATPDASTTLSGMTTSGSVTPDTSVNATPFPTVTPNAVATLVPTPTPNSVPNMPPTSTGVTGDWADVRTATSASAPINRVDAPNTTVTIYATVSGQIIGNSSTSTWYRISSFNTSPLYIYAGDLTGSSSGNANTANTNTANTSASSSSATNAAPTGAGKIIVVSILQEELEAYNNGQLFISTPVATGQVQLPTPTGTYHIFAKYSPYTFISPWPVGSPFYYVPSTANYAMEWRTGGYFLHDAPWRGYFGKGANYLHWDPKMGEDPGTHGCIDVPTPAMAQIFSWATIGTTIQINP